MFSSSFQAEIVVGGQDSGFVPETIQKTMNINPQTTMIIKSVVGESEQNNNKLLKFEDGLLTLVGGSSSCSSSSSGFSSGSEDKMLK